MTKAELISFVKHSLAGLDKTAKFHDEVISAACERAWNQIVYDTFRKDLAHLGFYAKEYDEVDIVQDNNVGFFYSTLPEEIIQLPDYGQGVRRISLMVDAGDSSDSIGSQYVLDNSLSFVPISEDEAIMYNDSEVFSLDGDTIHYIVNEDKVIYSKNMDATVAANKVRMRLVIPFRKYASTDVVHIPSGKDYDFINLVRQFLGGIPPVDLKNNNSDIR